MAWTIRNSGSGCIKPSMRAGTHGREHSVDIVLPETAGQELFDGADGLVLLGDRRSDDSSQGTRPTRS